MPPHGKPSKEGPDPINVLISIMKPGGGRYTLIFFIVLLTIVHFLCYSDSPSVPPLFSAICNMLSIACPIPFAISINIIRILLSILTVVYIGINLHEACKKKSDIVNSFHKNQPQFFTIIVVFGGTLAILIPMILNVTKLIGDGAPLTTALLGITGGIIAIFGYYKTHQKSELEKEQLYAQKQKDARDHIRQLHGSYNDRFDKAVAELNGSDVKAAYAAVPKLAKLADAWLDYKDLSNNKKELKKLKKKAKKEAQTIINILCKYVRTMPGEYTEENLKNIGALNSTDQDSLKNESEVRRLIFSEMSHRSSKANFENENSTTVPGIWSKFNFDFTGAPIFYPLNNLKIEKGIFTSARFYSNADFRESTFIKDVDFKGVQFTQEAYFDEVTFNGKADFSAHGDVKTTFGGTATFNGAQFTQEAYFDEVTFNGKADFSAHGDVKTTFGGTATFNGAQFTQEANFNEVTFNGKADFSTQGDAKTTFGGTATFNGAQFTQEANFNEVTFNGKADFSTQGDAKTAFGGKATFNGAQFTQEANFNEATFKEAADFSTQGNTKTAFGGKATFNGVQFTQEANFSEVTFNKVTFNESTDLSIQNNPKTVFRGEAVFNDATFNREAVFYGVLFKKAASFNSVLFCKKACFKYAIFKNSSSFTIKDTGCRKTEFKESANFQSTLFKGKTSFKGAIFNGRANFYPNRLDMDDMKFAQEADFSYADFKKGAHFFKATFEGKAIFDSATFCENNNTSNLKTQTKNLTRYDALLIQNFGPYIIPEEYTGGANFSDAIFNSGAYFTDSKFYGESYFVSNFFGPALFTDSYIYKPMHFTANKQPEAVARFSIKNSPTDYNVKDFRKKDGKGNNLLGIKIISVHYGSDTFEIPENCQLFDPDAPGIYLPDIKR